MLILRVHCSSSSTDCGTFNSLMRMKIDAVIFDWGGTLCPWLPINFEKLWADTCKPHFPPDEAAKHAMALHRAEQELWQYSSTEQRSATMAMLFERANMTPTDDLLASYIKAWEPYTFTDPEASSLLAHLRGRGARIGLLSNTMWPRRWHEDVFNRDGVLDLIDGAIYSSEIDRVKPHEGAFQAAMAAVGATEPARCVFVGDRPYDDIHGAQSVGMRAVLLRNNAVPEFDVVPEAVIVSLGDLWSLVDSWLL
jgi:putative hydrolase of the HAD superfamily